MLFHSGAFFFFFLAVYLLYLALPHRKQNLLLLGASYFFYAYWDYRFLVLVIVSSAVDYLAGLKIEENYQKAKPRDARRWLIASLIVNFSILGFFKYFNFFADNLVAVASSFGMSLDAPTLEIILPLGISFYTFQSVSYTIDVYRKRIGACREFSDFLLYVAFFPQLIAGPIERARKLLPQIQAPRIIDSDMIKTGSWLIYWGVFKKVFIADNIAPYSLWAVTRGAAESAADAWLGCAAFSIQFYCDFSAYSDIAMGLAALLGIKLSRNFNLPYFSTNPSDLWMRWHITLTTWFRDYVYAGIRKAGSRSVPPWVAVLVTMTLVGLWHGAQWKFVFWGACWGAAIIMHRVWRKSLGKVWKAPEALAIIFMFAIWNIINLFFVTDNIDIAFEMQRKALFDFDSTSRTLRDAMTALYFSWPVIAMQFLQRATNDHFVIFRTHFLVRLLVYALMGVLLFSSGAEYEQEFIYFQF